MSTTITPLPLRKFRHHVASHVAVVESFLSISPRFIKDPDCLELCGLAKESLKEIMDEVDSLRQQLAEAKDPEEVLSAVP